MAATEEVWLPTEVHNNDRSTTTGMTANVSVGGEVSESFGVTNGVKQGYVLAPYALLHLPVSNARRGFPIHGLASTYSPDRALTYSTSHTSERRPRLLGY